MSQLVSIKGSKEGVRLFLDDAAEWSMLLNELRGQLEQGSNFFSGARLTLDIGKRALTEQEMQDVLGLMGQYNVQPEVLLAAAQEARNAARASGLNSKIPSAREPAASAPMNGAEGSDALVIHGTIRSGRVISYHGHIILIGDVNPGSEIIAGGNVIVWGRLRGLVHAGALGDSSAIICALELRVTQLRIAALIARTPEGPQNLHPEVARIESGQIIVEAWQAYRR